MCDNTKRELLIILGRFDSMYFVRMEQYVLPG